MGRSASLFCLTFMAAHRRMEIYASWPRPVCKIRDSNSANHPLAKCIRRRRPVSERVAVGPRHWPKSATNPRER